MKKLALLTLALIAAGAANAGSSGEDEYNEQNRTPFIGSMSRAEVQAQYADAVAGGMMQNGEYVDFAVNQQAGSSRDVGAVREEAIMAARTRVIQELMV